VSPPWMGLSTQPAFAGNAPKVVLTVGNDLAPE
jgi:hypothetical protein